MQISLEHREGVQQHLNDIYSLPPPENDEYTISSYLSGHDRCVVIAKGREILEVIEVERLHSLKNADWEEGKVAMNYPTRTYEPTTPDLNNFYNKQIYEYVTRKYGKINFKYCFGITSLDGIYTTQKEFVKVHHHSSHALGAFYQSPFKEALVLTYDGGSPDHVSRAVYYVRRGKRPILIDAFESSIVGRYQDLGLLFECFEWQPAKAAHTLPGKIMALASFGKPNLNLLDYYKNVCSGTINNNLKKEMVDFNPDDYITSRLMKELMDNNCYGVDSWEKEHAKLVYQKVITRLFFVNRLLEKEGFTNSKELAPLALAFFGINYLKFFNYYNEEEYKSIKRIPIEKAFDMAATLQRACEELFFDVFTPYINKYSKLPIVLAGGGALNIVLNTRIKKETGRDVFVSPDPSDCGLALGAMLGYLRPEKPYSNPYTGMPIVDINTLPSTVMEHVGLDAALSKYEFVGDVRLDLSHIAKLISDGKIIGVMRGNSERGPRALGNRSIICSASLPHIKDTLNAKVKFREWFRPFAPIVRLKDVSKYFEWEGESRYMNFCIDVKEEYRDKLQAITHVDGTARVQTITREQNWFIYDILTHLNNITGIGVIVNTSFNVNGRPLINSVKDAFKMLENTELDGIIVQNTLVLKK